MARSKLSTTKKEVTFDLEDAEDVLLRSVERERPGAVQEMLTNWIRNTAKELIRRDVEVIKGYLDRIDITADQTSRIRAILERKEDA